MKRLKGSDMRDDILVIAIGITRCQHCAYLLVHDAVENFKFVLQFGCLGLRKVYDQQT